MIFFFFFFFGSHPFIISSKHTALHYCITVHPLPFLFHNFQLSSMCNIGRRFGMLIPYSVNISGGGVIAIRSMFLAARTHLAPATVRQEPAQRVLHEKQHVRKVHHHAGLEIGPRDELRLACRAAKNNANQKRTRKRKQQRKKKHAQKTKMKTTTKKKNGTKTKTKTETVHERTLNQNRDGGQ